LSSFVWDVLTLFPEVVSIYVGLGILGRARNQGKITVGVHNIRDYTYDKHSSADDYPYGGGVGMVLKPEPIFRAVDRVREESPDTHIVMMSPQGRPFHQAEAIRLAREYRAVTLICGRYEGVDERVVKHLIDEEISIGDYVISGGELAALVVLDAVSRCIPGVVGDEQSVNSDSFSHGILKHSQYTRPEVYRGMKVPEVLVSGHHEQIKQFHRFSALAKTVRNRPDLLDGAELSHEDQAILKRIREETGCEARPDRPSAEGKSISKMKDKGRGRHTGIS